MDARILQEFRAITGDRGLITSQEELKTYECDGLTNFRVVPQAVLLPRSTEQVQGIVRVCHRERIPFVARGSGTGLSGGALPVKDGVVISLARMNRILEVDLPNARVVVEPGVINLEVTGRVAPHGFFYAPDPSSQSICSIGGNVAENSGGAHCLKYGFTTTHVLGLEVVLPDGSLAHLGGKTLDAPGYDLPGVFVGSEGTLGIATKVILRIVKRPECIQTLLAAFGSTSDAGAAVSGIIAAGMLPAAIEMMDNLAIQAAEAAVHANYPDCGGLLLVELDGPTAEVEALMRAGGRNLPEVRRLGNPRGADGGGARRGVEGTQGGVRRGRPHFAELHRAGRRDPAHGAAAHHESKSSGSARRRESEWPMCFTPATATCIHWSFMTAGSKGRSMPRRAWPTAFSNCASRLAAPSRASMAWAKRRK